MKLFLPLTVAQNEHTQLNSCSIKPVTVSSSCNKDEIVTGFTPIVKMNG